MCDPLVMLVKKSTAAAPNALKAGAKFRREIDFATESALAHHCDDMRHVELISLVASTIVLGCTGSNPTEPLKFSGSSLGVRGTVASGGSPQNRGGLLCFSQPGCVRGTPKRGERNALAAPCLRLALRASASQLGWLRFSLRLYRPLSALGLYSQLNFRCVS